MNDFLAITIPMKANLKVEGRSTFGAGLTGMQWCQAEVKRLKEKGDPRAVVCRDGDLVWVSRR